MKLIVTATNWVGDAVMAIPALEAIRKRWPQAEIAVLARPSVAELYRGQGYADRIILQNRGVRGREAAAAELRREKFETALLLPNSFGAAWVAWRAGIRERIGYRCDGRSLLLTQAVRRPRANETPEHETYYYLELLRRIGWIERLPEVRQITLRVSREARQKAEERLSTLGARPGRTRLALAPGASYGAAKCWAPERYAALADEFVSAYDADVILFGTPPEAGMAARIQKCMRSEAYNLVGATGIGELPALLATCQLFIGNDSGAMHVAGAVGLPVAGIFGSSDPDGTSPLTPKFALLRQPVSCSPCYLRRCPIDHRCMTRISVADVFGAAQRLLSRAGNGVNGNGTAHDELTPIPAARILPDDGASAHDKERGTH